MVAGCWEIARTYPTTFIRRSQVHLPVKTVGTPYIIRLTKLIVRLIIIADKVVNSYEVIKVAGLRKRGESIRQFILENVEEHPRDIVTFTSATLGISRQAVSKHVQHLVAQEVLVARGATRSRHYALRPVIIKEFSYALQGLREDVAWRNDLFPMFSELPDNVTGIWQYGFTEMLNNAVDHSSGSIVAVQVTKTATTSEILVYDDGEGIFNKIQRELDFDDERHAVLELAKGKLTTDPAHHTGEGIFFSSRMFDLFIIMSGKTAFSHQHVKPDDWVLEAPRFQSGTVVFMKLKNKTARTSKEIFDSFTSDDDYGFTKTIVPVELAQYGDEKLISRSQAKRLLARFDRFKKVILDFKAVESIGQAFADEVFRVFPQEHPNVVLVPMNANRSVQQIITRAIQHD